MSLSNQAESSRQAVIQRLEQVDSRNLDGKIKNIRWTQKWGAFGVIFRGLYNGSVVCIKAFKNVDIDHPDGAFLKRLAREMTVWRKLTHEHVVWLHGWIPYVESPENLCPSLVSDWCDEGDVTTFLKRSPHADREALICGIAHGLEYLHSEEIVHGDMKPDNVVVSGGRTPQLCDFGLSFIVSDTSTYIHASSLLGTARYVAPEVFESEEPFRDKKTDVWAFGCTAMEILRSEPPYPTIRNDLAVFKVIGTILPFNPSATQPTEETLVRCFDLDPEGRINMGDVTRRLEQNGSTLTIS